MVEFMLWSHGNPISVWYYCICIIIAFYFLSVYSSSMCTSGGYFNLIVKGQSIIPLLLGG